MAKLGSVIKCKHCGKEFTARLVTERYCSKACYYEKQAIRMAEYNYITNEKRSKKTVVHNRVCIVCGAPFQTKRTKNLCCSGKCDYEYKKNKNKYKPEEKIDYTPPKKICVVCGAEFITTRSNKVCCSPECVDERHKEQMRSFGKKFREKKKAKPPKSLSEVLAEMKAAGYEPYQYGKYMAEQYLKSH